VVVESTTGTVDVGVCTGPADCTVVVVVVVTTPGAKAAAGVVGVVVAVNVDVGIVDGVTTGAVLVCVGHLLSVCVTAGVGSTVFVSVTTGVVAAGSREMGAACVDFSVTTGGTTVVVVGCATAMIGAVAGAFESPYIEEGGFPHEPAAFGAVTEVVVDPGAGIFTAVAVGFVTLATGCLPTAATGATTGAAMVVCLWRASAF